MKKIIYSMALASLVALPAFSKPIRCEDLSDPKAVAEMTPEDLYTWVTLYPCLDSMNKNKNPCLQRLRDFATELHREQTLPKQIQKDLRSIESKVEWFVRSNDFCQPPCSGKPLGVLNYSKVNLESGFSPQYIAVFPSKKYDLWIDQPGRRNEPGESFGPNVIVFDPKESRPYYFSYMRNNSRGTRLSQSTSCVDCHTNGLSKVNPVPGTILKSDRNKIEALNERILSYGKPNLSHLFDEKKLGPPLGKKFGCTHCHGSSLNVITHRQAQKEPGKGGRIEGLTDVWFLMPPGNGGLKYFRQALILSEKMSDEQVLEFRKQATLLYEKKIPEGEKRTVQLRTLLLDRLESSGLLSHADRLKAGEEVLSNANSKNAYKQIHDSHKNEILEWLREPLKSCDP